MLQPSRLKCFWFFRQIPRSSQTGSRTEIELDVLVVVREWLLDHSDTANCLNVFFLPNALIRSQERVIEARREFYCW